MSRTLKIVIGVLMARSLGAFELERPCLSSVQGAVSDPFGFLKSAFDDEPGAYLPEDLKRPTEGAVPNYELSGPNLDFYQWSRAGEVLPFQGWKFHVTADKESQAAVLELLPFLRELGVAHKVAFSWDEYEASLENSSDPQRGKYISIYPRSDAEADFVAGKIDEKLKELNLKRSESLERKIRSASIVDSELELGDSGFLFTRYGGISSEPKILKDGSKGVEVEVQGRVYSFPFSPELHTFIVDPDGKLVQDQRESMPSWLVLPPRIQSLRR